MIQFSRLRINGFKSFVDRTDLEIAPGLNGIVGPNGCGKSNLVEALRWAMGEASAKRMRGGGMEDVIFAGTDKRAPRNIAEVTIVLDNQTREAPAAYNGEDTIEVTRRIERDHGSNYKINGKSVRARDVQMLFADTVTGSNSPALVSQGRVTQMINAKPHDRRLILEESAGISGLYARRHEAELRLKAADTNLVRIEDILGSMESRLNGLKRQARQASRYRNISAQMRQMDVLIAWLEWRAIDERIKATRAEFEAAESAVAEKLGIVTALTKTLNTQSEDIPGLRTKEAEAAAALQNQKIVLQRIEDEAARQQQLLDETLEQLARAETDIEHEKTVLVDNQAAFEKLESEQKDLSTKQNNDKKALNEKQDARDALEKKVLALEERYTAVMEGAAETRARKQSLEQQISQNKDRLQNLESRKAQAEEDLKPLKEQSGKDQDIASARAEIETLEASLEAKTKEQEKLRTEIESTRSAVDDARQALSSAETKLSEIQAEISTLASVLQNDNEDNEYTPLVSSVKPQAGFELALSRALGESLLASLEDNAPARWITRNKLPKLPALPAGVKPLDSVVDAPKQIHLALSQIGLVDNAEAAQPLISDLMPGQALVSQDGDYWRWDGYCVRAGAADQNAMRLEQQNRLKELERAKPKRESTVNDAKKYLDAAQAKLETKTQAQDVLLSNIQAINDNLRELRQKLSDLRDADAERQSEISRLSHVIETAEDDITTLREVIGWDEERLNKLEDAQSEQTQEDTDALRATLQEARETYQAAVSAFDRHQQEQNTRKARLHAIADERINIQNRTIRARERTKELEERLKTLRERKESLVNQPKTFEKDKEELLTTISKLEEARNQVAEKLAEQESEVQETSRALREAEQSLSAMKEKRAGAQATLSAIEEQRQSIESVIEEKFDMPPAQLPDHAAIDVNAETDDLETLKAKRDKLNRERDNIGPVNLRADDEATELEKEVTTLLHERNDLMQAIEELRGGIAKINKEARERLITAFEHVNAHFQSLFTRLFAGGKAHLALIDSDDPLGAGLEVFAQPPGKALQSLSLLSGGEQTLASIALIFAMFLTNPSPICVLDEIDAPLDDANVDRVCDLLEEIAERGETRFLVITHHRMTMARMDRLYGVTMAERGVSQLVSVDLQQSFGFLEEAA